MMGAAAPWRARVADAASGFFAALQFLTRIPVPRGDYPLQRALVWLPVVGLLLGGVLAAADGILRWLQVDVLLNSTLLVVLLLLLTGGLHADGLMDTCDAVFGHATPERRLEIMRDPRAGAFGVIGIVCVVALKIAALEAMPLGTERTGLVILAPVLGRWSIVLLAAVFPYGRPTGLGAPLKAAATPASVAIASLLPVIGCVVIGPVDVVASICVALAAYGLGRWLVSLLPGLTGDCYGATCELMEMLFWLCSALVLARLPL